MDNKCNYTNVTNSEITLSYFHAEITVPILLKFGIEKFSLLRKNVEYSLSQLLIYRWLEPRAKLIFYIYSDIGIKTEPSSIYQPLKATNGNMPLIGNENFAYYITQAKRAFLWFKVTLVCLMESITRIQKNCEYRQCNYAAHVMPIY